MTGEPARRLLAEVVGRARNRRAQLLRLSSGGPIHAAMRDAQRSDLALIQLLLIAMGDERVSVDRAAEKVGATWNSRWDNLALLDAALIASRKPRQVLRPAGATHE